MAFIEVQALEQDMKKIRQWLLDYLALDVISSPLFEWLSTDPDVRRTHHEKATTRMRTVRGLLVELSVRIDAAVLHRTTMMLVFSDASHMDLRGWRRRMLRVRDLAFSLTAKVERHVEAMERVRAAAAALSFTGFVPGRRTSREARLRQAMMEAEVCEVEYRSELLRLQSNNFPRSR